MDVDDLREFRARRFGWLAPDGRLLACDGFRHFEALKRVPSLSEAVEAYEETVASNERAMREDLDSLEYDEHPAMHRFDGMNDAAKELLSKTVYREGWLRLGMQFDFDAASAAEAGVTGAKRAFLRRNVGAHVMLEVEGLSEVVDARRGELAETVDVLGCGLMLRRMTVTDLKSGRLVTEDALVPARQQEYVPPRRGAGSPDDEPTSSFAR